MIEHVPLLLSSEACDSVNPIALFESADIGPCVKWVLTGVGGESVDLSWCWGEGRRQEVLPLDWVWEGCLLILLFYYQT